jgi:hypothetical protein
MAFNPLAGFSNPWAAGGNSAALNTPAISNKPSMEALQTNIFDNDREVLGLGGENQEINKYVKSVAWVKSENTNSTIKVLPFKDNDDVAIKIEFYPSIINKIITCKILDSDKIFNDSIIMQTFQVKQLTTVLFFNLNPKVFTMGGDGVLKLFVRIVINSNVFGDFCNQEDGLLIVQIIRYVPFIMKQNGWNIGYELQKKWFTAESNDDYSKQIDISNLISFNYFLKFKRFKDFLDNIISQKLWLTDGAKKEIVKQINIWIVEGRLKLPTTTMEFSTFGSNSLKIVFDSSGRRIPEFDKYHIQHKVYEESIIGSPIDDLFCALGDFQIKMIIFCKIYFDINKYTISLIKVGFYINDKFDFKGFQPLGFWSPSEKAARKIPLTATVSSYYYVSNGLYRDYRELTKMGSDFHLFSDLYFINDNSNFQVDYTTDCLTGKKILKHE